MKILYHHRTLAKDGQNVHITEMLKAFAQEGHSVKVVAPEFYETTDSPMRKLIAFGRQLLPSSISEYLEILYSRRAYRKLKKAYDEFQPDFLYERYNLFTDTGKRLKEETGVAFVLEVNAPLASERRQHGKLRLYKTAKKMEQAIWQAADVVIPVTSVLGDMVKDAGVAGHKIKVMHNGIDPDQFTKTKMAADRIREDYGLAGKTVLGFTGFLRPWHRLDRVLVTMAKQQKADTPALHLMVVGESPEIEKCKAQASELNVTDQVTFTGAIERDQMAAYIACFDIALQPAATGYASPLKIFEYLALGKPVLAPDQPNIREILTHNHDSKLFSLEDDDDFERQLTAMVKDKEWRQQAAVGARATLTNKDFFWTSNAKKVIEAVKAYHARSPD